MITKTVFYVVVTLAFRAAGLDAAPGGIEGRIQAPDGTPLAGAHVSLKRVPKLERVGGKAWTLVKGEARFETVTKSVADGRFRATDVPEGFYHVCPSLPSSNLLSFCEWSYVPRVHVSAGRTTVVPDIRLERGTLLRVTVEDPQTVARVPRGPRAGANLIVGVRKGDSFHGLRAVPDQQQIVYITPLNSKGQPVERVPAAGQVKRSITRHVLEAYVPIDTDLRLWIHGPRLQMRDAQNVPVSTAGLGQALRLAASAQPFTLTMTVTGGLP